MKFSRKLLFYYVPALLWAGVIFYFSSIPDLKVGVTHQISWEVLLRKFAHIAEFALLAVLVWRIFFRAHGMSFSSSFFWSLLLVTVYSASDELHQLFVEGRAGKIIDVSVDFLGIIFGLLLLALAVLKRKRGAIFLLLVLDLILLSVVVSLLMKQALDEYGKYSNQESGNSLVSEIKKIENLDGNISSNQGKENSLQQQPAEELKVVEDASAKNPTEALPKTVSLEVPFSSQAPYANWDEVHEEACEETSLIMLKYFLDKKPLDKETAENQIQKMKDFQLKKYGDYKDSDMKQLVRLAEDFYGLRNLEVIYDFDKQEIKRQLAKGNPIILPTAGRKLGNPNFTSPGPLYHNLVVVGYDGDQVITNDPGTRKGKGFIYNIDVIYQAVHDFPGKKEDIEKGRKAMIVIKNG